MPENRFQTVVARFPVKISRKVEEILLRREKTVKTDTNGVEPHRI